MYVIVMAFNIILMKLNLIKYTKLYPQQLFIYLFLFLFNFYLKLSQIFMASRIFSCMNIWTCNMSKKQKQKKNK